MSCEWIPISAKKPPLGKHVLVSHSGRVLMAHAGRGEWVETHGLTTRLYPMRADDAWMPLPAPWKADQSIEWEDQ